jgi:hypothetical protein
MIAHVLASALVAHSHLVSAFTAIGDAVRQRCAIAWDSTALDVLVLGAIVAQHRLDLLEGLPIDIGRVGYDMLGAPTQKPAAHRCGRVLGETIHFEQNTMVDRTGQAEFECFIHRGSLRLTRMNEVISGVLSFRISLGSCGLRYARRPKAKTRRASLRTGSGRNNTL